MMTTVESLNKIQEFKGLLVQIYNGAAQPGTRSRINQLLPLVSRIVKMTGTGKSWTVTPPPMVGGPVMHDYNPLDNLFTPPYGMYKEVVSACIDIADSTIGVLQSDENFIENHEQSKLQNNVETGNVNGSNRVFIVHGRDNEKKESCARALEHMGLNPIILHEQPNKGKTIIEKFEEYSDVGYAVVLMTPDDIGGLKDEQQKERARQNVVFELGYFIGKLGRNRVTALVDGELELPTDISGVVYTDLDSRGLWKYALAKELNAVGYTVDLNKIV